jgi:hypothetical protein
MQFRKALLATTLLMVPGIAAAQPVSGLYIAGGFGANWLQETDLTSSGRLSNALTSAGRSTRGDISFEWGYVGVISLGWGFGNGPRTEVEGNYRTNDVDDDISGFGGTTSASGSSISYGVIANVFYDFDFASLGIKHRWLQHPALYRRWHRLCLANVRRCPRGRAGRLDHHRWFRRTLRLPVYRRPRLPAAPIRARPVADGGIPLPGHAGAQIRHDLRRRSLHGQPRHYGERELQPLGPDWPALRLQPAAAAAAARGRARPGGGARAGAHLPRLLRLRSGRPDRARAPDHRRCRAGFDTGAATRIEVAGYADRAGNPQYNQRLSKRRAQAVAAELERRGVPRSAMVIQGFGEERPLVPTADGVRVPQNRRVEIILR